MRRSALFEMLYCIRCGACLNACPVFREIGGHAYVSATGEHTPYPGPMGSVVSPGLFGTAEFGQLARASSLCGACQEACPVDIPLPKLLLRVRAAGAQPSSNLAPARPGRQRRDPMPPALNLGLRLFAWVTASPRQFRAAQRLAGFTSRLLSPHSQWLRLPAFTGWGASRDFPRPAAQPFRSLFQTLPNQPIIQLEQTDTDNLKHRYTENSSRAANQENSLRAVLESKQELIDQFGAELHALGGQFFHCTAEQAAQDILALLQAAEIQTIHAWEPNLLPIEIVETLTQAGIRLSREPDASIRAGLTAAMGGIACTGSLALTSSPGQPLTTSLLPEIHFAILKARDIVPDVADLLRQGWITQAANTVLISGPSRTADIEMTLTIGVHGPRQLYVFCMD